MNNQFLRPGVLVQREMDFYRNFSAIAVNCSRAV
jgi:hypothetical protein